MRLISKERAYAIASSWGSYVRQGDPGACFYGFPLNDGRPVDEAHRTACLIYARHLVNTVAWGCYAKRDFDDMHRLINFLANCKLREA